jgi:hypothetical protein
MSSVLVSIEVTVVFKSFSSRSFLVYLLLMLDFAV